MKRPSWKAFSLIEILVVIGIVITLAVITSSALRSFQQRALVVADLSNLRQLGVGALQYIGDNNGRLAPVQKAQPDGKNIYAQECIALELGIMTSLRATNVSPKSWGPLISPSDRRSPPLLSPLRCYGVNFYMGEITVITNDSRIATHYSQVVKPSEVLYFLPLKSSPSVTNPDSQGRFSENTSPLIAVAGAAFDIRFDTEGNVPALWADGHASIIAKANILTNTARYIFPKFQR